MYYKKWFYSFVFISVLVLLVLGGIVYIVDPCFHYRKPNTSMYYILDEQRYQNDGIVKYFDYNSIVTGTSMTENFKSSEVDRIFAGKSIKVPFSGGTYKEVNDNLKKAFDYKKDIRFVIRSLDIAYLNASSDGLRKDMGDYPYYLYNDKILDDIYYIFNIDVLRITAKDIINTIRYNKRGVTSFDDYCYREKEYKYGKQYIVIKKQQNHIKQNDLRNSDKQRIYQNVMQNVVKLAKENPDTTFYYFYPPYSIAYWGYRKDKGQLVNTFDGVVYATELILEVPNIKLYYFGNMHDITTNLDNYRDLTHYSEKINSRMLEFMHDDIGLLTKDNYKEILNKERTFLLTYPYNDI